MDRRASALSPGPSIMVETLMGTHWTQSEARGRLPFIFDDKFVISHGTRRDARNVFAPRVFRI